MMLYVSPDVIVKNYDDSRKEEGKKSNKFDLRFSKFNGLKYRSDKGNSEVYYMIL